MISPWKRYIVSTKAVDLNGDGTIGDENGDGSVNDADRALATPTSLVRRAHLRGLDVHTWTFRNEPRYLAADYGGDPYAEYAQFFGPGIDGLFSDFADSALAARDAYFAG